VRFDNLVLVPASLLPHKLRYQQLANTLPRGQVLILVPDDGRERRTLRKVAAHLTAKGHPVTTLPASCLAGSPRR
jgi:hypothetical protein